MKADNERVNEWWRVKDSHTKRQHTSADSRIEENKSARDKAMNDWTRIIWHDKQFNIHINGVTENNTLRKGIA